MSLKQRLRHAKAAVFGLQDPDAWRGNWLSWGNSSVSVQELTLLQMTSTWSCIRLITESIGVMPFKLYKRTKSGRESAREHDIAQLMSGMPNEYMTGQDVIESLVVSLCCTGQSYSDVVRFDATDRVVSFTPLQKAMVKAEFDRDTGKPVYSLNQNGHFYERPRRDLCPIRGFGGPGALEGYAIHELQRSSLAVSKAAEQFAEKYFAGGGRPPYGYISTSQTLTSENRKEIKDNFSSDFKSKIDADAIPFLEMDMKFLPISNSANEAQMSETRKQQIAEAARIYRVPLSFLFEGGNETYANREQATIQLLNHCLIPYMKRIEKGITQNLLSSKDQSQFYFEFDVRGLLRGDNATRAQYYKDLRVASAITANEIRDAENLPRDPAPESDQLFVPLNMAPAGEVMNVLGGKKPNAEE